MIKLSENEIEDLILGWLNAQKIFAWKNPTTGYFDTNKQTFRKHTSQYAINGVSDIIGILPDGRALFIEVKSENGKISLEQQNFIEIARGHGAVCFVARSLKDVEKQLEISGYIF